MKIKVGKLLSIGLLVAASQANATTYNMPASDESLIGQVEYTSGAGESVVTLSKRYDLGYNAMESANPHVNMVRNFTLGTPLQLPTQHLLPNEARRGIVVNLPEMRMYYYLPERGKVLTYPIGIGKIGKTIPIIREAKISRKAKDPIWIPPEDIREFNLEQGVVLPQVMPPGPDNPLGPYAIYTSIPTYLIHSTIFPESVGKRASFGCIRMYETDIEEFFPIVEKGVPLAIINSPAKVGWQHDKLYLEAHVPLEEHNGAYDASLPGMVHMIHSASQQKPTLVDWQAISYINRSRDGLPHEVATQIE